MTGVAAFFGIDPASLLDEPGPIPMRSSSLPSNSNSNSSPGPHARSPPLRHPKTRRRLPEALENINRILRDTDPA